MYNLLVSGLEGTWDLKAYECDKTRFLEYSSDKEKLLFNPLSADKLELLKSFPCLFAYEGTNSPVRIGYLRSIKDRGGCLFIEFEFDPDIPPIPFSKITPIRTLLDFRAPETFRTHWAVKDENLFLRLYESKLVDAKYINAAGTAGRLEELQFKVAFSFPGELRSRVEAIVGLVKEGLPKGAVFYDNDFTAQLARPNLDNLLQAVYLRNSALVVIFLSGDYESKMWCGIEWRAIRGIINNRGDKSVMFIRSDLAEVPGVFLHDGYVDLNKFSDQQVSKFVLERVALNELA